MMRIPSQCLRLLLLLASSAALAQEPSFSMPKDDAIAKAQQMMQEAMRRLPSGAGAEKAGSMPNVESLPKPSVQSPDLASIAEKYRQLGQVALQQQTAHPDLLVLVSLSMPKEALVRLADQAEKAGATLVFRGLKGDSMMKMGQEIQKVLGGRNVSVAIHPPAFQQFSVDQVPAVVIARPEAGNVLDNGCSRPDTFVKVTGDVSLDYALDYIERRSPYWAAWAKHFRSKIVKGIN